MAKTDFKAVAGQTVAIIGGTGCGKSTLINMIPRLYDATDGTVKVNGKDHWVMIIHPYMARDLKLDTVWLEAQKHANVRGEDNPIFSGALGVFDNVVIHEHENISITTTGATSAPVGHALMLGAQAGALAVAQETNWAEKTFNYGKSAGFEVDTILGVGKSKFNSVDFATIQVMASAAAD